MADASPLAPSRCCRHSHRGGCRHGASAGGQRGRGDTAFARSNRACTGAAQLSRGVVLGLRGQFRPVFAIQAQRPGGSAQMYGHAIAPSVARGGVSRTRDNPCSAGHALLRHLSPGSGHAAIGHQQGGARQVVGPDQSCARQCRGCHSALLLQVAGHGTPTRWHRSLPSVSVVWVLAIAPASPLGRGH